MSTENKIVGSITVSAQFEREDRTYYATVVFDLHEDGQRSLRAQRIDDGRYVVHDQDFQEEAYALMHQWDTRELELTVEQLKRENAALREAASSVALTLYHPSHCAMLSPFVLAGLGDTLRAALSPQEAARG